MHTKQGFVGRICAWADRVIGRFDKSRKAVCVVETYDIINPRGDFIGTVDMWEMGDGSARFFLVDKMGYAIPGEGYITKDAAAEALRQR